MTLILDEKETKQSPLGSANITPSAKENCNVLIRICVQAHSSHLSVEEDSKSHNSREYYVLLLYKPSQYQAKLYHVYYYPEASKLFA